MLFCSLFVSCDLTKDDSKESKEGASEYPDENFSIVGTWEYNIPPCTGFAPTDGCIYNALGYITFTDDNKFSFVINSDNGKIRGYGTYDLDEDLGLHLIYAPYKEIEIQAREKGYIRYSRDIYQDYISWGNYGDRIEENYMLVHSTPVREYKRIQSQGFDNTVSTYRSPDSALEDDWYLVSHSGTRFEKLPNEFVKLYIQNDSL